MPIYEYFSSDTQKVYSFYSRTQLDNSQIPICPDGKSFRMEKMLSGFSVTGLVSDKNGGEHEGPENSPSDPFDQMSEKQSSHIMQELERNLGGIDDENPDPRQMGKMMRKMCELTGEKLDGVIEEVVRKLEEGTSPEELEQNMDGQLDESGEAEEMDSSDNQKSALRNKGISITRDPKLYEMHEYLP